MNTSKIGEHPESLQQPNESYNNDNPLDYVFNVSVNRSIAVDEENNQSYNQENDDNS